MTKDAAGPALSAIFVDYDNIYMALKRRNEEAAKRFSKDAALWLKELESGRLITSTGGYSANSQRRIVLNRCYGNPMPRRNQNDNSTDMNSFPFVRHHFLRSGSEVIDCPPLTAQLKNSADIRIVMDVRDMISHDTYFDEFIILSGDADFTPLLHRLRAHARRTVIYANDHTAQPYTAISDGEVRESDLLRLLLDGSLSDTQIAATAETGQTQPQPRLAADMPALRRELINEVVTLVRQAGQPVPLEALADRLVRQLGHEKTSGSGWGGSGGFRDFLMAHLPAGLRLSDQAPFVVFEAARMLQPERIQRPEPQQEPQPARTIAPTADRGIPSQPAPAQPLQPQQQPQQPVFAQPLPMPRMPQPQPAAPQPAPIAPAAQKTSTGHQAMAIQQAVARIYEACQAPPLSPPEYRTVFEVMTQEINTRGLTGAPTLDNIVTSAKEFGVDIRRDDVRFLLDVVSESDPWFEQGASANLFASRFRNFVVARCRSHGLALTADELDLIEHWFAGTAALPAPSQQQPAVAPVVQQQPRALAQLSAPQQQHAPAAAPLAAAQADRWWSMNDPQGTDPLPPSGDDFPRIIRSRMRG